MKRLIIACALLVVCVTVSIYCFHRVDEVTGEVNFYVGDALEAMAADDKDSVADNVERLITLWEYEEDRLVRLVRHSQIDDITKSVARLEALTEGGDYTELAAELSSIRWQMDHVYSSEKLLPQNLL